ncbi:MAG: endonuclease V [Cytophagales bacterium]|nr:MAG: endonuclease V [Cytophagales bacterium]
MEEICTNEVDAWQEAQRKLASEINIVVKHYTENSYVMGLDVQYVGNDAYVAATVLSLGAKENYKHYVWKTQTDAPYIPQYFAFKEGPVLKAFIERYISQQTILPDIFVVDGQGTAHPRKAGLACWLGVALQKTVIGCAKESLLPYESPSEEAMSYKAIRLEESIVGYMLRSQSNTKPICISAGHLINQEQALAIIQQLIGKYRNPDVMRLADQTARTFAKGILNASEKVIFL